MLRLTWIAWTVVLLIVCLSCRTDQSMVQTDQSVTATDEGVLTGSINPVCPVIDSCSLCYVDFLDPSNLELLLRRCSDDAPGLCCGCGGSGGPGPGGDCCDCTGSGGELSPLPKLPGGQYIVRVGPEAVVTLACQGQPVVEHRGPAEFTVTTLLPMKISCQGGAKTSSTP
jgi:hypothetical protein